MAAMIISCQLFEAYLFCPLKCWLRSRAEPVTGNKYAEWTRAHKEAYYREGLKRDRMLFRRLTREFFAAPYRRSQRDVCCAG